MQRRLARLRNRRLSTLTFAAVGGVGGNGGTCIDLDCGRGGELDGVVGQREYLVSVRAEPASHVNGGERERAQSLWWTMAWSL